jgi:hypothetical protein
MTVMMMVIKQDNDDGHCEGKCRDALEGMDLQLPHRFAEKAQSCYECHFDRCRAARLACLWDSPSRSHMHFVSHVFSFWGEVGSFLMKT